MKFMKKALIIGGGVAGPAAALFLKRAGCLPEVFEAEEEPNPYGGLFLNVGRNGLGVLDELGVGEAIRESGFEMRVMSFRNGAGKQLGAIGDPHKPHGVTVKRSLLQQVLLEQTERENIPVSFGKKLTGIERSGNEITAYFHDGSSTTGDFLIGCDGIHSRVRKELLPDAAPPSFTGLISFGGFSRVQGLAPEPGVQNMVFGKRAFFGYLVKEDGEIYWFGNMSMNGTPTRKSLQSIPEAQWRKTIDDLYSDDPAPILDIIQGTDANINAYPIYDMLTQPVWHTNRAVLIGDAIHAVSPNAGQGASLALEDALVLAKCVRDSEHIHQAFALFQQLRKERVERIVRYSRSIGQRKHATSPVQVFFRDLMLPQFLKASNKQSLSWMYDYPVRWNEKVSQLNGGSVC
ncbi:FAD-dependent oxidoreductase [Paenibacillus senegalensis]|uniref:FAD-dependent oxidoreductase n=1 Tax=Paenibacillus senegalensis TaxID=1465766 RepID=UPI000287B6B2|nr:FAD-dependent monooxygenase [Paenibacillus senegalensis]